MTSLLENISLALAGLRANKMRALLTMLGIIIGISAVITITTLGNALQGTVTSTFESLGANSVILNVSYRKDVSNVGLYDSDLISNDMLDAYRERFGDRISYISITDTAGKGTSKRGFQDVKLNLMGVTPGTDKANAMKMVTGRFITDKDVDGAKPVVVISDTVAEKLFRNENAVGKQISVSTNYGPIRLTVVGVYKFEMNSMMLSMVSQDIVTYAMIPVSYCRQLSGNSEYNYQVQVGASAGQDYNEFASDSEDFFNRSFYSNNPNFEIDALAMQSAMDQMTAIMGTVSLVVSIIAAISLLVGGIGVMNIMLVSVTERTREIGVRKALGAPNSAIRIQFIVESMIICLIGGIIGIIMGLLTGNAGAIIIGSPASASPSAIVIAVTFSLFIGVFFGYYPANKAAKLDPIEALRYE